MTSHSADKHLQPRELADYGFARVRDIAFDAVNALWRRRRDGGMKQVELARIIGRDPGWISKNLSGPGNWTLRTFGELVEGLDGRIVINVYPSEEAPSTRDNYSAYHDHGVGGPRDVPKGVDHGTQFIGNPPASSFNPPVQLAV